MKNTLIISVIAALVITAGLFVYAWLSGNDISEIVGNDTSTQDLEMNRDANMTSPEALAEQTTPNDSQDTTQTTNPLAGASDSGEYVEYSSSVLTNAADNRRVLFFYANWCPTCQPADQSFSADESRLPADVTVIRVNYNDDETSDEETALANQYGVTYQHTYVQIDEAGNVVTTWNGGDIDELLTNIE